MPAMLASASLTWKYSANTPSLVFENFQPPSGCWDCDECPSCEATSPQSGVMAPTTTRSPGMKYLTSLPTAYTTPTASWPRVRFSRGPIAPWTVCESDVQINARVVLTMASFGPGCGIGLTANPTRSIDAITNARIVAVFASAPCSAAGSTTVVISYLLDWHILGSSRSGPG